MYRNLVSLYEFQSGAWPFEIMFWAASLRWFVGGLRAGRRLGSEMDCELAFAGVRSLVVAKEGPEWHPKLFYGAWFGGFGLDSKLASSASVYASASSSSIC